MAEGIKLTPVEAALCRLIYNHLEKQKIPETAQADAGRIMAVILAGMIMAGCHPDREQAHQTVDVISKLLRDHIDWLFEVGPDHGGETLQ